MKPAVIAALAGAALLAGCSSAATPSGPSQPSASPSQATSQAPASSAAPSPSSPSSGASGSSASAAGQMSLEQAGQTYLAAVCPAIEAEKVFQEIFTGASSSAAPDEAPSARAKEAALTASVAEETAATLISDPSLVWPAAVRDDIQDVADQLSAVSVWFRAIAEASRWADIPEFPEFDDPEASANVRSALDLPPRGECP